MSDHIYKVVELVGSSTTSIEDAMRPRRTHSDLEYVAEIL